MSLPIYSYLQNENRQLREIAALMLNALVLASDTLSAFDKGDPTSKTGWDNDELFAAWQAVRAAITRADHL